MFSKKLLDAMNEQMKNEFASAYLYLAMAAHFEAQNLPGFASWMKKQAPAWCRRRGSSTLKTSSLG